MKRVRLERVEGTAYGVTVPVGAVYVGGWDPGGLPASKFDNPHPVGRRCRLCAGVEHSRGAALIAYRRWLEEQPALIDAARTELAGKDVACWCSPTEQCHGDILVEMLAPTSPNLGEREPAEDTTAAGMIAKFEQFHADNPHVYRTLVRLARQWVRATGRQRIGIAMLWERMRWELAIETTDEDPAFDNNHKAFYARLIMRDEPDLAELFDLRRSVADEWLEAA